MLGLKFVTPQIT